jgi:hypothetical protein
MAVKVGKMGEFDIEIWPPFACIVRKIIYNKRINRFLFVLGEDMKENSPEVKVHLVSQLFPLAEKRFISKSDLIYVEHYSITNLTPRKGRIIFLASVKKVVCGGGGA